MRPYYLSFIITAFFANAAFAYKVAVRQSELETELSLRGIALPTGDGIGITQVEAVITEGGTNYLPSTNNSEFAGKSVIDQTGGGTSSSHATTVGINLYGNSSSITPNITNIDIFEANEWLSNWGSGIPPIENNPLQNHSWVAENALPSSAHTLRMDFAVLRDRFLPVAGLKNNSTGGDDAIPVIYGSIYNGITVGLSNGNHRTGTTEADDGPGRVKPEIVAPSNLTSFATPMVTAAAAFLIEAAHGDSDATNPLALKATLLAAADKSPFIDWDQTETRPIDDIYGVGQLDLYEAYFIQAAGKQDRGSTITQRGWNLSPIGRKGSSNYNIEVPTGFELRNLSTVLTWNREVTRNIIGNYSSDLADMRLTLRDAIGTLQTSDSAVDNLEHIWRDHTQALPSGNYSLKIENDISVDYAIAWRYELYQDYSLWSSATFTEATPVEERDAIDDPDGDGLSNELERALSSDPEQANTDGLPSLAITSIESNDYLELSFFKPTFENGLTYSIETTTDLTAAWSSDPADVELVAIETVSATHDRYTFRRAEPLSNSSQAFLRLNITQ